MLTTDFENKNDGEKMALLEGFLDNTHLHTQSEWVDFLLVLLKNDSSPCVRHEAAFCLGQMSHQLEAKQLEKIADIMCDVVENDNSMVVKHEVMEAMGDAQLNTERSRTLLEYYKQSENYDLSNTARISYWQITGEW